MITRKMLKEWVCEPDTERLDRLFSTPKTPFEVLTLWEGEWSNVSDAERIDMLMQDGAIRTADRIRFAVDCATRALLRERRNGREPDPRSWHAVEIAMQAWDGRFLSKQESEDLVKSASAAAVSMPFGSSSRWAASAAVSAAEAAIKDPKWALWAASAAAEAAAVITSWIWPWTGREIKTKIDRERYWQIRHLVWTLGGPGPMFDEGLEGGGE